MIYWPYHVSTHVALSPKNGSRKSNLVVSWALGTQSSSVAFVFLGFFFAVILKIVFLCTDFGQFLNYKDTFLNMYYTILYNKKKNLRCDCFLAVSFELLNQIEFLKQWSGFGKFICHINSAKIFNKSRNLSKSRSIFYNLDTSTYQKPIVYFQIEEVQMSVLKAEVSFIYDLFLR